MVTRLATDPGRPWRARPRPRARAVQGGKHGEHRARQAAAVRAGYGRGGRHVVRARARTDARPTSRRLSCGSGSGATAGEQAGLFLVDERLHSTGDAADKARRKRWSLAADRAFEREALAGFPAVGLWLWRASAGPTTPRLNGRRHCARSVCEDVSGLAPAPAAAPWLWLQLRVRGSHAACREARMRARRRAGPRRWPRLGGL